MAETDGGSKSKKSSGDSKGSKGTVTVSRVSSKEEKKICCKPPLNSVISQIQEDYMTQLMSKKRKEIDFRRDSLVVYSGLKGTFMQAYRPSLDEKAQNIASTIHGVKMLTQHTEKREELIKLQEKAKLLMIKFSKPTKKKGDITNLVYSKEELEFKISKQKLLKYDI